jgi:hypothetical protein
MSRPVERVLDEWRDAERRLAELDRDTVDYIRVRDEVDGLAYEYRALVDEYQDIADDLGADPGSALAQSEGYGTVAG